MSCFFPNLMRIFIDSETGEKSNKFLGPAYVSDPRSYGSLAGLSEKGEYYALIPCGKCLGCRCDYARRWANRMIIELKDNDYNAMFITLTYNRQCVPRTGYGDLTLSVRDVQLFFKRLRKRFSDRKIRYYLCGEYGSRTHRPHYHAIVYGLTIQDFPDLRIFGNNQVGDPYYTSQIFEKIWSNGFVMMSDVTYQTCGYVSRYCTKKQAFSDRDDTYDELGILRPFNLSSRNPGLGLLRAEEFVLSGMTSFSIPTADGVHTVPIPKEFLRHVKDRNVGLDVVDEICYNRAVDSYERLLSDLSLSELSFPDYLRKRTADFKRVHNAFPIRDVMEV